MSGSVAADHRTYMNVRERRGTPNWLTPSGTANAPRRARARVEVVAHDVGEEDLERAEEEQQREARGDERRPQPRLTAHEREALAQLPARPAGAPDPPTAARHRVAG